MRNKTFIFTGLIEEHASQLEPVVDNIREL